MPRPSILLSGLRLTLSRPGAFLWTYAFNLGIALLVSIRYKAELNDILAHSLISQRLTTSFDLGVLGMAIERLNRNAPATGSSGVVGPILFFLIYFLLVPGTLLVYTTNTHATLRSLLAGGLSFFWRFVAITLITGVVSLIVLGPLLGIQAAWATHVANSSVGYHALILTDLGYLVIFLVACILRLYFDLVEVYTVALAQQTRPNGNPDRRFYRTLLPAVRTLVRDFLRVYAVFVLLALLGFAAIVLTTLSTLHHLAQPRAWPIFLIAQLGLFLLLFTRFWQRAAETVLAGQHPILTQAIPTEPTHPYLRPETMPLPPAPIFDKAPPPPPTPPDVIDPDPKRFS